MGWQDDLKDSVRRATEVETFGRWPVSWREHRIRTTAPIALALTPHLGALNSTEFAGIPPGRMRLLSVIPMGSDFELWIGVRLELPWNRTAEGCYLVEGAWLEDGRLSAYIVFPEVPPPGGGAWRLFDFRSIVESWRDRPPLF